MLKVIGNHKKSWIAMVLWMVSNVSARNGKRKMKRGAIFALSYREFGVEHSVVCILYFKARG